MMKNCWRMTIPMLSMIDGIIHICFSFHRSRHRRSVAWLRKTEYLSTEHYNKWNKSEKIETKLGHNVKQRFSEEIVYRDKDSQIKAIESTFTAAKKPITHHYSKRDVRAIEVLPILPDFVLWKYPCAQVCPFYILLHPFRLFSTMTPLVLPNIPKK